MIMAACWACVFSESPAPSTSICCKDPEMISGVGPQVESGTSPLAWIAYSGQPQRTAFTEPGLKYAETVDHPAGSGELVSHWWPVRAVRKATGGHSAAPAEVTASNSWQKAPSNEASTWAELCAPRLRPLGKITSGKKKSGQVVRVRVRWRAWSLASLGLPVPWVLCL